MQDLRYSNLIAPIGMGHSVFLLFSEGSGLQSHGLKTELGDGRKPNARRVGYELRESIYKDLK